MPSEASYQRKLVSTLKKLLPGCHIVENDPQRNQGIPDLLILFRDKWAMLEIKLSEKAPSQPNQHHHVSAFNNMSFAAFIYPENEREILIDLQHALGG